MRDPIEDLLANTAQTPQQMQEKADQLSGADLLALRIQSQDCLASLIGLDPQPIGAITHLNRIAELSVERMRQRLLRPGACPEDPHSMTRDEVVTNFRRMMSHDSWVVSLVAEHLLKQEE